MQNVANPTMALDVVWDPPIGNFDSIKVYWDFLAAFSEFLCF